jgi:photosystem II oxygen-evolving enhancer protein 2
MGSGQEVVIEGQDKVFKDVIEPLESVSVNMIQTNKQDIKEFGSPQQVWFTYVRFCVVFSKRSYLSS